MPSAIGGVPIYSLAAPVGWIRQQMPEFGARHCVGWVAPAGAPPDPQKPPIRRAGPVLVGGTVSGGWPRVGWVAPCWVGGPGLGGWHLWFYRAVISGEWEVPAESVELVNGADSLVLSEPSAVTLRQ